MNIKLILYIIQQLRSNLLRTFLTVLGIVIGIAAVVGTMTLGLSYQETLEDNLAEFGADIIYVIPRESIFMGGPPSFNNARKPPAEFDDRDIRIIKAIANVQAATPEKSVSKIASYKGDEVQLSMSLIDPTEFERINNNELETGRLLSRGDQHALIIGHAIANDAFEREVTRGSGIIIDEVNYKVVGIFKEVGGISETDSAVYAPLSLREELGLSDTYSNLAVKVYDETMTSQTAEEIEEALSRRHRDEAYSTLTQMEILDTVTTILNQFNFVFISVAAFSLLVGGIGIMNIMFVSVTERTKEIGTLKALGAREKRILQMFIIESGIIGLIGGGIGSALGYYISIVLQTALSFGQVETQFYFNPFIIIIALGFAFIVGMISGTYPAYKASKLDPISALRYE